MSKKVKKISKKRIGRKIEKVNFERKGRHYSFGFLAGEYQ